MDIKAPLKRTYFPSAHNSGPRSLSIIRGIVLHSTEGDSAAGAAAWFKNPAAEGSAHIAVDSEEGYRCVADDIIAWGAGGYNTPALHVEHAAHAAFSKTWWLSKKHRRMLKRSAFHVARWCKHYSIPARYMGVAELRAGQKGITFHYTVTEAFHASTHTDPGPGFPKRYFLRQVKKYLKEM